MRPSISIRGCVRPSISPSVTLFRRAAPRQPHRLSGIRTCLKTCSNQYLTINCRFIAISIHLTGFQQPVQVVKKDELQCWDYHQLEDNLEEILNDIYFHNKVYGFHSQPIAKLSHPILFSFKI